MYNKIIIKIEEYVVDRSDEFDRKIRRMQVAAWKAASALRTRPPAAPRPGAPRRPGRSGLRNPHSCPNSRRDRTRWRTRPERTNITPPTTYKRVCDLYSAALPTNDMSRSKGGMKSPGYSVLLLAVFNIASCNAGPLPNTTIVDVGLKEGSCALGDVVYMSGDSFPGTSPCESCGCAGGEVTCTRQRCEPRPGCKAVHRPDHCCPTYQCECEQEGRTYGNGEKLVDPRDPCRVCYCQGGEVVCRRIACFLRDDCRPRLVPGRCCPEYDNCPLRGVTSIPGIASSLSLTSIEEVENSAAPVPPVEPPMPSITIKEITPVSEIPVTDVKIKEILPSPGIEVEEYTSPKSPSIVREANSEKSNTESGAKIDPSDTKAILSSSDPLKSKVPPTVESEMIIDQPLSKISISTQNTVGDHIVPSKITNVVAMMGSPSEPDTHISPLTTKAPIIEEDDLSFLDHNPAFPPIPDDLSVLGNHDDEILPEQNLDNEHVSMDHDIINVASSVITQAPVFKETTTLGYVSSEATVTKANSVESSESSTFKQTDNISTATVKDNPMLNMRSVIPTEILNAPSLISDDVNGDLLDVTESPTPLPSSSENVHSTEHSISRSAENKSITTASSPDNISDIDENQPSLNTEDYVSSSDQYNDHFITPKMEHNFTESSQVSNENSQDETTKSLSQSTDVISETEFSSIPIETSDQNPHETIERDSNDTIDSTVDSEITSTKLFDSEGTTVSREVPTVLKDQSIENGETTEYIPTAFGSQESSTDAVEFINVADTEKSSALIDPSSGHKSNVLTDLINLVGDVASISDTEAPDFERQTSKPTTISDSEELIPVNVASGYKSKNKNWNQNSITEVPIKNKVNKHKLVEIEGEDTDTITDSPPPNDKVEPTTRRAIIDNVSDDNNENKTEIAMKGKKDIEIITQSYVPTINRRPTKVIMEKSNEKPISDESSEEDALVTMAPATVRDHTESDNGEHNSSVETESSTEFVREPEAVEESTSEPNATQ